MSAHTSRLSRTKTRKTVNKSCRICTILGVVTSPLGGMHDNHEHQCTQANCSCHQGHSPNGSWSCDRNKSSKAAANNICQLRQTVFFTMTVGNKHKEYGETSASCEHLHGAWSSSDGIRKSVANQRWTLLFEIQDASDSTISAMHHARVKTSNLTSATTKCEKPWCSFAKCPWRSARVCW